MTVSVALLRGVNMVGRNKLPMQVLSEIFEELGCGVARTYLQSGNVVFSGAAVKACDVTAAVEARMGFAPRVQLWSRARLKSAAKANPFLEVAEEEPRSVHAFFLEKALSDEFSERLSSIDHGDDSYHIAGKVLYLHTPNRFQSSKLGSKIERDLKGTSTARNWRTVKALCDMADEMMREMNQK